MVDTSVSVIPAVVLKSPTRGSPNPNAQPEQRDPPTEDRAEAHDGDNKRTPERPDTLWWEEADRSGTIDNLGVLLVGGTGIDLLRNDLDLEKHHQSHRR